MLGVCRRRLKPRLVIIVVVKTPFCGFDEQFVETWLLETSVSRHKQDPHDSQVHHLVKNISDQKLKIFCLLCSAQCSLGVSAN